jgi:hypothetical protein
LVLAFAHGTTAMDISLAPGMCFAGTVCFFPGSGVRAVVKSRGDLRPLERVRGLASLDELCNVAGGRFAQEPWLTELAAPLHQVTPMKSGDQWMMVDSAKRALTAALSDQAGWLAMAMAGGRPIELFAGYDGLTLRPLAMMAGSEYVSLVGTSQQGG